MAAMTPQETYDLMSRREPDCLPMFLPERADVPYRKRAYDLIAACRASQIGRRTRQ